MIYKKSIIFIITLSLSLLFITNNDKAFVDPINGKTLIIYNNQLNNSQILNNIKFISEAFSNNVTTININNYSDHLINNYSKVIIVSSEEEINNTVLLENIKDSNIPICWIGKGINKLINVYNPFANITENNSIATSVIFKNNTYPINIQNTFYNFQNLSKLIIKSTFNNGSMNFPYIFEYKNIMYVAVLPDSKILMNIFCENLYKFFNVPQISHNKEISFTLKLDNMKDISNVLQYSDYLHRENISFWVIVPSNLISNYSKDIMNALNKIQNLGGSIILSDNSNINYNDILPNLLKNDIPPMGIYLSKNNFQHYENLKNNFSLFLLGNSTSNYFNASDFPYKIVNASNTFIIDNLNIENLESEYYIQKLKYYFSALPNGSFSNIIIPSNVNLKLVEEIVICIKSENPIIVDVKKLSSVSNFNGLYVKNDKGIVSTNYKNSSSFTESTSIIGKLNNILIIIIGGFCIVFLIIFIYYRYLNKKKFLR